MLGYGHLSADGARSSESFLSLDLGSNSTSTSCQALEGLSPGLIRTKEGQRVPDGESLSESLRF